MIHSKGTEITHGTLCIRRINNSTRLRLFRGLVALRVVVPPLVLQLGQLTVLLQFQHCVVQLSEEIIQVYIRYLCKQIILDPIL